MSNLFDELRKKVDEKKAQQEAQIAAAESREDLIRSIFKPTMRRLYSRFKELKELLETLQPDLRAEYEILAIGKIANLKQGDYRIWTDLGASLGEDGSSFTFQYAYLKDVNFRLRPSSREDAFKVRDYLWKHSLRFKWGDVGSGTATITLQAYIPVMFEFSADYDKAAIRLKVRNLGSLGTVTNNFPPQAINEEFTEEIAKCVMHEPNRFSELSGNLLSQSARDYIRQQLAEQKRQQEVELTAAQEEDEPKGPLHEKMKERIRGIFQNLRQHAK